MALGTLAQCIIESPMAASSGDSHFQEVEKVHRQAMWRQLPSTVTLVLRHEERTVAACKTRSGHIPFVKVHLYCGNGDVLERKTLGEPD